MTDKKTILVVEDNDFVRMQIVSFLSDASYNIIEATDGREAIDKVEEAKGSIALAVVDVRMDPIDGFEFIRMTRGMNLDLPVILVTGDDTADLLHEAGKWDVTAVLMKPVQRERLVKMVERIMKVNDRKA